MCNASHVMALCPPNRCLPGCRCCLPPAAGAWLALLGASLPSASAYFLNYIVIHALCTNFFRFVW